MEDTLRDQRENQSKYRCCLNPCFNGRYTQRVNAYDFTKGYPES